MNEHKVVLKHSLVVDKIPEPSIMSYGEIYINGASGTGKSFISTKKGDNTVAKFMEKEYNDATYADKSVVTTINGSYISSAVMDTGATNPSVSNHILTIPTITSGTVSNMIGQLDGNATIATKAGDVVTLKASVIQSAGEIANGSQSDITLGAVATTSDASDLNATYQSSDSDVQAIITSIDTRLTSLEGNSIETIICDAQSSSIPSGATYSGTSVITGTMAASNSTMGNIYLVKYGNSYNQYCTTKNGSTYSWANLGSTSVDLSGYINAIVLNGKSFTANGGNSVDLGNVVTDVNGETEVSNGNGDYISVSVTGGTASNGAKTIGLSSMLKIQSVSGATASSNGLATAKDIKDYVQDNLTIIRSWTDVDIVS